MTENIRWLVDPYRLESGFVVSPGWVDRSAYPEIPDNAFDMAIARRDDPMVSLFLLLRDDIQRSTNAIKALTDPK